MIGKADIIIGIDPDVNKSGVAYIMNKGADVVLLSLALPELFEYLKKAANINNMKTVVVVEASWLISFNWHVKHKDSKGVISAKGLDIGRSQEVGRQIVKCAQYYGLEVVEKLPLKKIWKGKDGKITDAEIKAFMPIQGRTNQEERDAALLAWDYAGLPIRLARPLKSRR